MGTSTAITLGLLVVLAGFAIFARRTRKPGESFSDAMDRVLDTESHQERMAGLEKKKENDS